MFQAKWFIFGLVASCLAAGCTVGKPVVVFKKITPTKTTPAGTPRPTATTVPGEIPSKQDHNLVVQEIKISPAHIGKAVEGHVINRGSKEYDVVNLHFNFLDAHGKVIGEGSGYTSWLQPGGRWFFWINMTDDSVGYKITDLSGK